MSTKAYCITNLFFEKEKRCGRPEAYQGSGLDYIDSAVLDDYTQLMLNELESLTKYRTEEHARTGRTKFESKPLPEYSEIANKYRWDDRSKGWVPK